MFALYSPSGTFIARHNTWLDAYNAAREQAFLHYIAVEDYHIKIEENVSRGTQLTLDFSSM